MDGKPCFFQIIKTPYYKLRLPVYNHFVKKKYIHISQTRRKNPPPKYQCKGGVSYPRGKAPGVIMSLWGAENSL